MGALFHLLFFASGFSGLLYEIVWARQLATVFGVSAFALSAVLSAYFLGLALGAWWIGRMADRVERPLFAYGVLEAGAAALAIAITLAIPQLDRVLVPLLDALEGRFLAQSLLRFGAALAVLVTPTILLGATLPVLARGLVARSNEVGHGVARLYAVNTAGAVAGVLFAGFVSIPSIGLRATAFAGAGIGFAVALTAFVASRRLPLATPAPSPASSPASSRGNTAVLVAFGVSGFCALALEVVVMRLLSHMLSSNTLVITSMLAVFLAGIAIGSAIVGRYADRTGVASGLWLSRVESGVGVTAVGALWLFALTSPWVVTLALFAGEARDAMVRPRFGSLAAAMIFLPPTLLLGASFPLAARAYVGGVATLGTRLGRLYGANTIGGVLGSFAAGFVLIPWLGAERSLQALALIFCANGAVLALALHDAPARGRRFALLAAAVAAVFVIALPPRFAESWLLERSGSERMVHATEDYYGTIAVLERRESDVVVRQLMVGADLMSNTSLYARRYMKLASHVPALLGAGPPRNGLVICFGVGITIDALRTHPSIERATVVELSRAVLDSAPYFEDVNHRVLADPRVRAVVEDGRQYLLRHPDERFDVITLEPPPPASAGVANLYSRDFYELAAARLSPGGVMAQWIPIATQTPEATRSLVRAFADVFPHVALFWTESLETLVVGSAEPLQLDPSRIRRALADPKLGPDLREIGVADEYDFASYYLLGTEEIAAWVADAEPVTDDRPRNEYTSAGTYEQNWVVLDALLKRRPAPAEIAARFRLTPGELPTLIERLARRLDERVKTQKSRRIASDG